MKCNFVRLPCVHNDRVKLIILANTPVSPIPEMLNRIFRIHVSQCTSDLEYCRTSEKSVQLCLLVGLSFSWAKNASLNKQINKPISYINEIGVEKHHLIKIKCGFWRRWGWGIEYLFKPLFTGRTSEGGSKGGRRVHKTLPLWEEPDKFGSEQTEAS